MERVHVVQAGRRLKQQCGRGERGGASGTARCQAAGRTRTCGRAAGLLRARPATLIPLASPSNTHCGLSPPPGGRHAATEARVAQQGRPNAEHHVFSLSRGARATGAGSPPPHAPPRAPTAARRRDREWSGSAWRSQGGGRGGAGAGAEGKAAVLCCSSRRVSDPRRPDHAAPGPPTRPLSPQSARIGAQHAASEAERARAEAERGEFAPQNQTTHRSLDELRRVLRLGLDGGHAQRAARGAGGAGGAESHCVWSCGKLGGWGRGGRAKKVRAERRSSERKKTLTEKTVGEPAPAVLWGPRDWATPGSPPVALPLPPTLLV